MTIAIIALVGGFFSPSPHAQAGLTMSDPDVLAKIVNNKTEIQRCIILATPDSLAKAREGLSQSRVISDNDKLAMLEMIRGISAILYPSPAPPTAAAKNPARVKNGETTPDFFVDPSIHDIDPVYSVCLAQLVEASQGKIFAAPKGSEVAFLSEILPSLAIFKTKDIEVAKTALGYAERFDVSADFRSVIPGLVKGWYERIAGDPAMAYSLYRQVLDTYPDAWPARLELGLLSLEMGKPVNALAFLKPLAESRANDPSVAKSYAVALYQNGKLAEAEPLARKALEYYPDSAELMQVAAHVLIDKNDFTSAQPFLDAFGKKKPSDRMYLYLKALLAKGQNRNVEALKWARKALSSYPEDPEIMVLLAGILFMGEEEGHGEAVALCAEAKRRFSAETKVDTSGQPAFNPLRTAMREEVEGEATRFLLMEAYNHQEWYEAAGMLEASSAAGLDKAVVATILRKSGKKSEALVFSSEWYNDAPQSEAAAEAYLRSLAAASTGGGVAAAGLAVSDAGSGLLGLAAGNGGNAQGSSGAGIASGQPALIGLVLQLLSGSCSAGMRSYLFYLRGTLLSDPGAAIDSYRMALLERADNVEAIAALAKAYAAKKDAQKALFYIRQAKAIGVADQALAAELRDLEASIVQG